MKLCASLVEVSTFNYCNFYDTGNSQQNTFSEASGFPERPKVVETSSVPAETSTSSAQSNLTARQRRRLIRKAEQASGIRVCCNFCKSNKETPKFYKGHSLKDENGKVMCPILRKLICPLCGATEEDAHTTKYCPILLEKQAEMTAEEKKDFMNQPQYAYRVKRKAIAVRKSVVRYV